MQRWGGRRQGAEGHCEAWTEGGGHADGWTALLTGGWTVTEHVLDAPRRRLIARRGDAPGALGPLDALDLRVAVGRARGAPIKALAAELGWTCSVVAHRLVTAQRRLQVRCEGDLVALLGDGSHVAGLTWPPPAPTGLVAEWDSSGGVQTLVVTYAAPLWSVPSCLSEAEVRVVLALVAGDSQQAIADARGLSRRTVANQIASIYRKLQVHGRLELLVALRGQGWPAARGEKA